MRTVWKGLRIGLWHSLSLTASTSTSSAVLFWCTILAMMIGRHCCIRWPSWRLDMSYRALHLPCCCLGRIGFNASSDGCVVATGRAGAVFDTWRYSLSDNTLAKVTISLENLFGRDIGTVLEETSIVENQLKILGNLFLSVLQNKDYGR